MKLNYLALAAVLMIAADSTAQQANQTIPISGIIVSADSLAIPDVAIVNTRTGKTIHTNAAGYFQTELAAGDSLFVYHIAYERRYVTSKNNGKLIFLKPEVHEIRQVNVADVSKREQRNLEENMKEIMQLVPTKTLTGYDLHSREDYFILENGSQTRGFSPYFGPTLHIPLEKITALVKMNKVQNEGKKDGAKVVPDMKNKKKTGDIEPENPTK